MSTKAPRGFRRWAASAALSALGDAMTFFALAWVSASRGPATASVVLTAGSIPLCLLVLAGGLVADHWGARPVMVCCDLVMAAVMGAFAVGALWAAPVWALVAVSFLSGAAAGVRRPAAGVFPRLFARGEELPRLMATLVLLLQLAQVTGPVVAGALLAWGGLAPTSGIDAFSFAMVGLVLLATRPPLAPERPPCERSWTTQLRDGVRLAFTSPGVPATVTAVCGLAVTILPLVELCVPLAGHDRGWGAGGTSLVVGAWPLGGMTVMAIVARRGAPAARVALMGPVTASAGALLLAVADHLAAGVFAVLLVGIGTSTTTARLFPRFTDATPEPMLARFNSVIQLAQVAPVLVATPALGWVAHTWGTETSLLLVGVTLLATTVAVHRAEVGLSRVAEPRHPSARDAQGAR